MADYTSPQLLALLLAIVYGVESVYQGGSVYCKNAKCVFKPDVLDTKLATSYGVYNDTLEETGWGILNITAGHGTGSPQNTDIMFAAGYLEGVLTQKRIYQNFQNIFDYFHAKFENDTRWEDAIKGFLLEQDMWMRQQIEENDTPYWRHMAYILAQYDGLIAGYKDTAPPNMTLSIYAFQILNGVGDLFDLMTALKPSSMPDFHKFNKREAMDYILENSRCSALVKVLGAYEDVFMSHSSWFIYQATMRIFKHYDFNVDDPDTAARRISFSSYPGFLTSLDDFYLMSSKLVMLQTTNNIFNVSLYSVVKPATLFAWHRVRLAHMMSNSGQQWAEIFAQHNSGTYTNQYMIVDLKKIVLQKEILDGALTVIEQIPGLVEYGDQTPILRTGYWPSYNVPFYERIYDMSGYPDFAKKHGTDFTYQLAPRAKIFRRDEGKVVDMASMKKIMRYNDYKHDPYSEDNSCNTICCRGDLKETPKPVGCYDTKVSSYTMALNFTADIINGPTQSSNLPPFQWTDKYTQSHIGLPQVYKFPFIQTHPLPTPQHKAWH